MKMIKKQVKTTAMVVLVLLITTSIKSYAQSWSGLSYGLVGWVFSTGHYKGELIVGGQFTWAGGVPANHIARWNGNTWLPLGDGLNGEVDAICEYNGELFAGGKFTASGNGTPLSFIARWDGTSWNNVSGGMDSYVTSLVVFNNNLIAGGYFVYAEQTLLNHVGRWNSQDQWVSMGSGTGGSQGQVMAMTVWNNQVIAGGFFNTTGGTSANHIASWNGSTWSPVGTGISGIVYALTDYQNNLVAGGLFTSAGGVAAQDIAMWNGSVWTPFGSGICCGAYGYVFALTKFENDLIAGGIYTIAGGVSAANIAKWNGSTWIPLATNMNSSGTVQAIFTLTVYNFEIIAGGIFGSINATPAGNIARYRDPAIYPPCSGTPQAGTVNPSNTTFCDSGFATLTVSGYSSGVTDISFQWQSSLDGINFNNLIDQNANMLRTPMCYQTVYYRCLVICNYADTSVSSVATITVNPGPTQISAPNPLTYCVNGTVLLQAPLTPGLEYKWRLNGVNIPGATAASYTATAAGNYSCWMEKSGCSAVSNTLLVSTSMCYVTINLKAFIEGYYMGFSTLNAAIDPFNQPNDCDTLVLSLASSLSPNPILYSDTAILQIDGTAAFGFPAQASGGNYYLVLNHRNSIETWSSSPVLINPVTNYDFTVSATTAYGNNLVNLGDGNFAIYSGDISDQALGVGFKDDVIESQDYLDMENAVSLVFIGYVQEDITGDGVVESYDYAIMENNVSALVFTNRP